MTQKKLETIKGWSLNNSWMKVIKIHLHSVMDEITYARRKKFYCDNNELYENSK